jgi:CBS domain-containing protein
MKEIRVKDVMTRGVLTVPEKATVREAITVMADCSISGLAVTSSGDAVVGILSQTDIIRVLDEDLDKVKVAEIMTSPAVSISQQESLRKACQIMKERHIHRLVVQVENVGLSGNGKSPTSLPCGILSVSDILEQLKTKENM